MTTAKQLFDLQEIDLQIEAGEKAVKQMTADLGESKELLAARDSLSAEQQKLDALMAEQKSLDWDIDDLSTKLKGLEKDLYSGRIRVPKELGSLQQEIAAVKTRRSQLEDRVLVLMEKIEAAHAAIAQLTVLYQKTATEWKSRQLELDRNIQAGKQTLVNLAQKRAALLPSIASDSLQIYQIVKQRKGSAVAKVEQGICRGCRILLPANELQAARSGKLVQCSSCGRILYLP